MLEATSWHQEMLGKKVVEALKKNKFQAEYVAAKEEVRRKVLEMIATGATVGLGSSMTIRQLGLDKDLKARGHECYDHGAPGLSLEEKTKMRRAQLTSDVFLSGLNAVTLGGSIVNVDGTGNRVASMIYGPKKVILVAGVNKIVLDLESAFERIELYASPRNNYRLGYSNPCVETGVCCDCDSDTRICNVFTIMKRKPSQTDITVFIVGEELGF